MSDCVLDDYLFNARAKAKLALKGLTPNDVMEAINDPRRKVEHSNSTGKHSLFGGGAQGRIRVVYEETVGKENRERAAYTVVTAYRPSG